jgi:hypothetical protein
MWFSPLWHQMICHWIPWLDHIRLIHQLACLLRISFVRFCVQMESTRGQNAIEWRDWCCDGTWATHQSFSPAQWRRTLSLQQRSWMHEASIRFGRLSWSLRQSACNWQSLHCHWCLVRQTTVPAIFMTHTSVIHHHIPQERLISLHMILEFLRLSALMPCHGVLQKRRNLQGRHKRSQDLNSFYFHEQMSRI